MQKGIGGHQATRGLTDDWITPKHILNVLGEFDLDPCASITQPWPTAKTQYTIMDNGLLLPWQGRIWLNPPYASDGAIWIMRLAQHGDGVALIFARTETDAWFRWIWNEAHSVLFLHGRLHFHRPNGERSKHNAGAPSALVAYGTRNARTLALCGLPGKVIHLKPYQEVNRDSNSRCSCKIFGRAARTREASE